MIKIIGIIDSGIGGYYILKALSNKYMDDFTLIMDSAYFPYGTKNNDLLIKRANKLVKYLSNIGCSKVIIACNTLSCLIDKIDSKIPIYGVIDITIKEIINKKYKNVCILATSNTINSNIYQTHLNKLDIEYLCIKCDNLIKKLEMGDYEEELTKIINKIPKCDCIILGCTHFIKVKKQFPYNVLSQDELDFNNKIKIIRTKK